jgi:GT2 family glycosyltransferase
MVAFGGGWKWVAAALDALRRNTPEPYEVILVDNGGAEDRSVSDRANVEIIRNGENVGFGPASNQGAAHARGHVICFLNTDVLVEPGWLAPLLERVTDTRVGAAVPMKLNVNGSLQEAGAFVTRDAHAFVFGDGDKADAPEHNFARDVDFGSAACLAITRRRFESTGGFDPGYRFAYFEDVDLCFRLRECGLRLVYEPRSRVTHVRTVAADAPSLAEVYSANREVFVSRWKSEIDQRPGLKQLREDARLQLGARDLHAPNRILFFDGDRGARGLLADLATRPKTRVTILTEEIEESDQLRLLATGVEVVSSVDEIAWLVERSGHYSHVVAARDARWLRLHPLLEKTQPQARFVDGTRLERAGDLVIAD